MGVPPRPRALAPALLALAAALAVALLAARGRRHGGRAFLAAGVAGSGDEAPRGGPLDWLHYEVIIASHAGYPFTLMLGFTCFGNVMLRKECDGKPYPNWLFGYILGFICYTYPSAILSDIIFVSASPRPMCNDNIFLIYTFWFVLIQNCEPVYKFFLQKHIFILLTTWWLADAQRAALVFLERAVAHQAVFARGVFQAFIWCSAGPILRAAEAVIRGAKVPPLDKVQPNTLNPLKYPLIAMFMIMIAYMLYMVFFTDCHLFAKQGALTMVECGKQNDDVYAAFVYLACFLHIGRSLWTYYGLGEGKVIFDHCMCGT